jgi:hypothetical protein
MARRAGGLAMRAILMLIPFLGFVAGVRFSGFEGEVVWQLPAIDVTVAVIERDGGTCRPQGRPPLDL